MLHNSHSKVLFWLRTPKSKFLHTYTACMILTIWSEAGLNNREIVLTRSCLLSNFSVTSIPSQHTRPLHHKEYTFSDSFIRIPLCTSVDWPSSPINQIFHVCVMFILPIERHFLIILLISIRSARLLEIEDNFLVYLISILTKLHTDNLKVFFK